MSNSNLNSNIKSIPIPSVSKNVNHVTNNQSELHADLFSFRFKEQSTYQICR